MSRAKGSPKTGGRKAGPPNKASNDIKKWVANILDSGRDEFVRRLASLDDRDYIRTYTGLLGYVMPKLSPTTPEELLKKEKEMLQDLLLSMPEQTIDKVTKRLFELQNK